MRTNVNGGPFYAVAHLNSNPAGSAGVQFQNDLGHALTLRVNGGTWTDPDIAVVESESSNGLAFRAAAYPGAPVERMRISAAGLVGIGLVPTTYRLEVNGDVNITGGYRVNGVLIPSSLTPWISDIDANDFQLNHCKGIGIGQRSGGGGGAQNGVGVVVWSGPGTNTSEIVSGIGREPTSFVEYRLSNDALSSVALTLTGSQYGSQPNEASLNSNGPRLLLQVGGNQQIQITPAGRVGIRTFPLTYTLEVAGDVSITGVYRINGVAISGAVASVFGRTGAVVLRRVTTRRRW